ncbi:MAG: hypothetical protein IT304_03730 [Dehalococcoidia bacterium]|nr:hypothetical protein [Dehalococcoidia bacterium]
MRSSQTLHPSRPRTAASLALLLLLAVLAGIWAFSPGRARAGLAWCAADPVISVNGQLISIEVNVPADQVKNVRLAAVTFHVPRNASAKIVFVDQSLFPQTATIVKDREAWEPGEKLRVYIEVSVYSRDGSRFDVAALVKDAYGEDEWRTGDTDHVLWAKAYGYVPQRG